MLANQTERWRHSLHAVEWQVPFVTTKEGHEGKGHCRRLLNSIENFCAIAGVIPLKDTRYPSSPSPCAAAACGSLAVLAVQSHVGMRVPWFRERLGSFFGPPR